MLTSGVVGLVGGGVGILSCGMGVHCADEIVEMEGGGDQVMYAAWACSRERLAEWERRLNTGHEKEV